jgi:putative RecB family exonuclease
MPPLANRDPDVLAGSIGGGFFDLPAGSVKLACALENEARFDEAEVQFGGSEQLGTMACPLTIARGARSNVLSTRRARAIAAQLVGASVEELAGLHHFGPEPTRRRSPALFLPRWTQAGRSLGIAMPLSLPSTLSPSKLARFVQCPLAFRYAHIDRFPEPSSVQQVRGTLVHRSLELLFSSAQGADRTRERALQSLSTAWDEVSESDEYTGLALDDVGSRRLVDDAAVLIGQYFALEDPTSVHDVGLELDLRTTLGGVELRGIIDRLDDLGGGELAVVDYKTGRAPPPDRSRSSLAGVYFYAMLCEEVLGKRPQEVRLMYLRDEIVLAESPTEQGMRGVRQRALAVWAAIDRACAAEDFRPSPSALCKTCAFQPLCPAFTGAKPTADEATAQRPG